MKADAHHSNYKNKQGEEFEVIENISLTEFLLGNYKKYVTTLEIVSDKSTEGNQFVKGFGGILRFKVDEVIEHSDNDDKSFD